MSFQTEHHKWLSDHLKQRSGERLDALKRGHVTVTGSSSNKFGDRLPDIFKGCIRSMR